MNVPVDAERLREKIRRREIYRYLGMKEQDAGEVLQAAVEEQLAELLGQMRVHSYYQIFPLSMEEKVAETGGRAETDSGRKALIRLGPMEIVSRDLGRNLRGCTSAALFGATLGMETDRLIYRLSLAAVGRAAITDACAAEALEVVCDEVCGELSRLALGRGERIRPRFSPGFGDFTLEYQPELVRVLELPKRIGAGLTAGGMLTPTKTVTAVVGFAPAQETGNNDG